MSCAAAEETGEYSSTFIDSRDPSAPGSGPPLMGRGRMDRARTSSIWDCLVSCKMTLTSDGDDGSLVVHVV